MKVIKNLFIIVLTLIIILITGCNASVKYDNKKLQELKDKFSGFGLQWALCNTGQEIKGQAGTDGLDINILEAWTITKGSEDVVVGILDAGLDIQHEALRNNIFTNRKEIPDNNKDDDGNGYVDDINGWNFYNDNNEVYGSYLHDYHGTYIGGIIAASGSSKVCGVAPNVKILPLKFLRGSKGQISDAEKAIAYAHNFGVTIINCSWDTTEYNESLYQTMKKYKDILFICSSGKSKKNLDDEPVFPACFELPNVISVMAIDNQGHLEDNTGYGSKAQVAAPGVEIYSSMPEGDYTYSSGTSPATAFVSGVAALVKSHRPNLEAAEIGEVLKSGATPVPLLKGKVRSEGIINAYECLKLAETYT